MCVGVEVNLRCLTFQLFPVAYNIHCGKCRVGVLVRRTPIGVRKTFFGVRRTNLESDGLRSESVGSPTMSDGFFSLSDSEKVRRTPIGLVGLRIGVRRTPVGLFGVRINFWTFRTFFRTL